jgi:hypothetical protein
VVLTWRRMGVESPINCGAAKQRSSEAAEI